MKQAYLMSVPYGTTFRVFGDDFVALDYIDGSVLAIRKEIWKSAPFDEGGGNDLKTASINRHLAEYENGLIKAGAGGNLCPRNIDLKATDGTREYGYCAGVCVSLLTLEQYGKYQHIIPDVDDWWWLATPWRTPAQKNGNNSCAWYVLGNGSYGYNGTYGTYGIRPALYFSSSLLVSIQDEEDAEPAQDETALYAAYRSYVREWLGDDTDIDLGESPLTFEAWKDAKEELGGDE